MGIKERILCAWFCAFCSKNTHAKHVESEGSTYKGSQESIEKVKDVLQSVKDIMFEMDDAARAQHYRLAHVIACHDDGTYDLSYDGIAEYNVPARLLRRPGSGDDGLIKQKVTYKEGDPVEGPIGWGSSRVVQLPESIKKLHVTKNMAAFNLAEPSKIQEL